MSGGPHRGRELYVVGTSPVHRLAASAKLVGLVVFTSAVALTPRHAVGAFVVDGVVLAGVIGCARLPLRLVLARLTVIAPFVVAAMLLPFISEGGEQVDVAGLSLSVDGSWAAWNIVIKAVLGATASIVLSATTSVPDLLAGLSQLKVPAVLVAIVSFMFRYLDVLIDELHRMRNAMVSRCHDPRWLWQVRPIASSAGALFVRSYERGERLHLAMLSRGYTGSMPLIAEQPTTRRGTMVAIGPGVIALAALITSVVWR